MYMDNSESEPEIDVTVANEELKELIKQKDESYREMQNY
jgi:type I restriction enzyme M protein